jgi:excisionase family DNA binding protein
MEDLSLNQILDMIAARVAERLALPSNGGGVRPRLLNIKQASEYLGRTEPATRHMVQSGKVPCVRSDRRILLDVRDLDRWIENHKNGSNGSE